MWFPLFYSPKPLSQDRIWMYRKWPIILSKQILRNSWSKGCSFSNRSIDFGNQHKDQSINSQINNDLGRYVYVKNAPQRNGRGGKSWTKVDLKGEHGAERNQQHLRSVHVCRGMELWHAEEVVLHSPLPLSWQQAGCLEGPPPLLPTSAHPNFFLLQSGQKILLEH